MDQHRYASEINTDSGSPREGKRRGFGSAGAFAVAVAIVTALTGILHARVGDDADSEGRAPMPVLATRFSEQTGYDRDQRFLGLVQAATRSQVGFEVPGAIASIDVREGDLIAAGAPLARLDRRSLEARRRVADATVERVAAELELARARSQRQAPLADSGAISAQTFDDTRLAEKALLSALEAARAERQALDIDLEKAVLRAPFEARVGRQLLDTGSVTQPGTAVFILVATAAREAHIGIAVEQTEYLEPGREYRLELRGRPLSVPLRAVRPDVDTKNMTTTAIFDLPEDTRAFDGEPVAVSLPRHVDEAGGWLPISALLEGERGIWTVLRLQSDDGATLTSREVVEVLHVSGDRAYVRGTLNNGDRVIADGVHRIAPGTHVQPEASRS